jgi:pyruvate/2-oxoglutarate dehydrogenase complex dihydrolipoamide dehydrogenase (E3) component
MTSFELLAELATPVENPALYLKWTGAEVQSVPSCESVAGWSKPDGERTMRYDAIVIGSGQGGNPLAYALAERGWSVALVEKAHLGGTCINTGCTPTKTMVASAQVAHYARNASRWGVKADNVRVDLSAVIARKTAVVERFRVGHEKRVANHKTLRLYRQHARFVGERTVQVGDDRIESDKIFVDTGTRPEPPRLAGLETVDYLTNESVLDLQEIPEHLLILGGGYIGLEFGQMFRRFGSRVTVIHKNDQLLAREDADVATAVQKALEAENIEFHLKSTPTKVEKRDGRIAVTMDSGGQQKTIAATHLLVATGRRPNTDDLGLEKTGVTVDPQGYIRVNGRMETGVPGIWALGDVKGGPAFTHISYNDYQILWANIIEGKNLTTENRYLPYALFIDPQLGRVGMTEHQARASGRKLKLGSYPMAYVSRAIERDETSGLMKIVVDAATDRILGAAILGTEGGELVQILGAMMLAGAPYTVLKGAVYIHPTLAEGFFGLMDAVHPVD